MHEPYNPTAVEAKWQSLWAEKKVYEVDLKKAKKPYYNLVMFPYPSGDKLHVGHWYNYAPADSYGRYVKMKGFDVFEPMGFDAFGLPAENYAIKTGVPPAESIAQNVSNMVEQLKRLGCMYDWKKMVNTSTPEYYQWTQWLFLQMYQNKLAYKKNARVNWCPKDQTVLANEQVKEGMCDRCGTEVIQKPLDQWFWKITDYSEKLLQGLEGLEWPEKTKLMQQHWIGKSIGAEINFEIERHKEKITVFTTRPDTLFGVTYVVLAPEHPLIDVITPKEHLGSVHSYREEIKKKTEMQRTELNKNKTGVPTGAFALHPVTGEKLPIWIADYVLMNYGTGMVMAVPGHDERDFDFAERRLEEGLQIKNVIQPDINQVNFMSNVHPGFAMAMREGESFEEKQAQRIKLEEGLILNGTRCWTGDGKLINSQFLDGLTTQEAKKKMIAWLEAEEKGRSKTTYRLRDWLVSRQRYWGSPIPIVYDPEGNSHAIPEKNLPWLLPTDVEFKPTGESPLKLSKEFKERTEKIFGKGWTPEYDTMDTFVCSSFYYLRYLMGGDSGQKSEVSGQLVEPDLEKKWMPVSMYIGGPEHACMHLIYARFVMMALKDFGFVSHTEPFQQLVHQGLITNQGAKMSKSKGNVVSPDSFVEKHGADVFRMYLMFMGPFTDGGDWSDTGIKGVDRFVQRLWRLASENTKSDAVESKTALQALHVAIDRVTKSLEILHFNTAISSLMELLNALEKEQGIQPSILRTIAQLLAPLAPHFAEELWEIGGGKGFVIEQEWPVADAKLLVKDTVTFAVQINGKLRATFDVPADMPKEEVIALAKTIEGAKKYLDGQTIKKEVFVPGRLVGFVL